MAGWRRWISSMKRTSPFCEVGEHAGEVAGFLDLRAGGGVEVGADGVGDDVGEGGLAEAGRAGEQDVVEDVAAAGGRPRP